jgi:hypothetical protein
MSHISGLFLVDSAIVFEDFQKSHLLLLASRLVLRDTEKSKLLSKADTICSVTELYKCLKSLIYKV